MARRLAVLLMVIAVGGCDNVEWGGVDLSIVPPPDREQEDRSAEIERALPAGPVLFYVRRDSVGATIIPVGNVAGDGLSPVTPGDDPAGFAARFTETLLAPGTQLTLFHRGQRMGTVAVDSAALPTGPVCRPLPRATGTLALADNASDVNEFLALAPADAPEGRLAGAAEERRMAVVADMLAGDMLRARNAPVPSTAAARRQLQPFPLTDSPDPAFAATYLVEDSLGLGGDDTGASLFVVFTPQGQTGYDTAFVAFSRYAEGGKAAPRVIDFLDWDRDQSFELLLEVFGTNVSWFRAVGLAQERWQEIFEDRCDPRTAPMDTTEQEPPPQAAPPRRSRRTLPALDSIPVIEPTIQLSDPGANPRVRRDTMPPDTGGG